MPAFAQILLRDLRRVDQHVPGDWPGSCGGEDGNSQGKNRPAAGRAREYVAPSTALRQQTGADPEYNVQDIDQWRPEGLSNG